MSIRTITRTYRHCDRCGYDDRENETTNFTEYPDGAGRALGHQRLPRGFAEGFDRADYSGETLRSPEICYG